MSRRSTAFVAAAVVVALSSCSASSDDAAAPQDPDAPIVAWQSGGDLSRLEAYAEANPDVDMTIEGVDNTQGAIPSRIALATNAGEDLPDVIFLSQPDEITALLANPVNFPAALNDTAAAEVFDEFADGTTERCTFEGQTYCLPNDIAQTVLYYNERLFAEFGYEVPATFEEFAQLGARLAVEHPGYSLGGVNGRNGLDALFGASGCQLNETTSPTEVVVNVESDECTRVTELLQPLMANGTLSTLDPFDPAYTPTIAEGRLLAYVAPSWMGEFGIKPSYPTEGEIAVAPMPTWDGESVNYSGAVGGGIWVVNSKSANLEAAVDLAIAMTTDPTYAAAGATYPAHKESADVWLEAVAADPWYASDPTDVLRDAAGKINPTLGYVRYQTQLLDIYNSTIVAEGASPESLAQLGAEATQAAEASGYTVATE